MTPQLPNSVNFFLSLLFHFAFSRNPNAWNLYQNPIYLKEKREKLGGFLEREREREKEKMGEKDNCGLELGLGLSLSLGCGGNQPSSKMNLMHKPPQLVQNHIQKSPWNETFHFPAGKFSIFIFIFFCFCS